MGSESQLEVLGIFEAVIEFKNCYQGSTIHILRGNHGSLLSHKTAADLGHYADHMIGHGITAKKMTGARWTELFST